MILEFLAKATPWTLVPFTRMRKIRKVLRLGYFCCCCHFCLGLVFFFSVFLILLSVVFCCLFGILG